MIGPVVSGAARGFNQLLSDGKLRAVLWKALGTSLLAVVLALVAAWFAVNYLLDFYLGWLPGFVLRALEGGALVTILGVAWILFPAIVTGCAGIFLDDAAEAVEQRYYPADPPGTPPPFWPGIWSSVKFAALVMVINLLLMPIYLLGLAFPPLLAVIFLVNALLLGREYFELVAFRHLSFGAAFQARRVNSTQVWLGGAALALGFTVPFLNLIVPVVGVAMMMHIFKHLSAQGRITAT